MRAIVSSLLCLSVLLLASCGGGGGGGSAPPPPPPVQQAQTIAFTTAGAATRALADATYTNAASGGAGTGAITYTSSSTAVATVSATGVVTFVTAGAVTITATKAADAAYLSATASYTLTITAPVVPQPQTIAFATAGPITRPLADGTYTNAASGGAGTGAITYQSSNTAVATVSATGVVTFVAAGSTTITANKAADANYLAASASYSLTITAPVVAQPQTIAFATAGAVTRPLADGSYTNAASGGAGTGAITYQSSNTTVATVSATGVVTFVAAGSTTITANKAADANYLAATASYSLTITAPVVAQPQTIAFANAGPVTRSLIDGSFTNAASGGAGTGAITYQSSNTAVATVSVTGVVTFVTAGSVTITANKAADANYLAATASYTLTIANAAAVTFSGWMGAADTQVTFSAGAANLEFLRSPQLDCNAANFASCTGGVVSTVGTTPVDNVAYLGREVNWWLRRGASVTPPLRINAQKFTPRQRHTAVSWRGKLWIIGGASEGGSWRDVWNSDDGESWTLVTADGGFPRRTPGTTVVFNDRLWLLGGMQGVSGGVVTWNNDVWSTGDGITWRRDVVSAPWPGRSSHTALVFNNRMWVIGGFPSPFGTEEGGDDAWSSVDGITWVEETHDAPFAKGAVATVMNGRIYTAAGSENSIQRNDVWSSADGRSWRLENAAAPFPPRSNPVFATLGNRLYLAAGQDDPNNGRANDVWSSSDGINWVEEAHEAPFAARYLTAFAIHNGRLWMFAGDIAEGDYRLYTYRSLWGHDIWSTDNGSQWREHSPHAGGLFAGTYNAVTHNGRMWIIGGWDGEVRSDTWSSADGMTWSRQSTGTTFPERSNHATTVFNGEFWISGGYGIGINTPITYYTDVWHSPDGINWTRATQSAAFGERGDHAMVAFNNQLYVLAGNADNGSGNHFSTNHVFSSPDGVTWTPVTQLAPFDATSRAKAVVFNGRLWLIGGENQISSTDVWSTADGISWRPESTGTPFKGSLLSSVTVHDARLWITAGSRTVPLMSNPQPGNELFSSADGITWTQVNAGPHYSPRFEPALLSFDNKLWVLGGTNSTALLNDVWMSADGGVTWRMRYVGTMPYP